MAFSKKVAAATVFGTAGLAYGLARFSGQPGNDVRVLIYHRVVDVDRAYDAANVSATPEQFRGQVAYLSKHYNVIGFGDLLEALQNDAALPERAVVITFDDGFSDNYEIAFPILREQGVGAAFFVSTSHIGSGELFWFDKVGFLLRNTPESEWRFEDGSSVPLSQRDDPEVLKKILLKLKALPNEQRIRQIAEFEAAALDGSESIDDINLPMSWDQLREMHEGGMEIYSHSHTHPVLSTLDSEDEIHAELAQSRGLIEEQIGNNCNVFAYPVGRYNSYDERTLRAVEACGYDLACINESGINNLADLRPFELTRIPVDAFQNAQSFKSIVAKPDWFAY